MHGPSAADGSSRRSLAWAALGLVALVALVHGRTLGPGWSWAFDDFRFVVKNPHVLSPASWLAFLTDVRTTDPTSPGGIVRPLRTLEFALDARLFGLDAGLFRAHSLLWFAAGATFLLLLLRDLVGDMRAAFVGAAVWVLHPMQTEAVDWISSRGDVASGALVLASVWTGLRARGRGGVAVSLVLAALAMLYKESGVVAPALVVLVRHAATGGRGRVRDALRGAWPWFAVAAAYLVYRALVQQGPTTHVTAYVLGGSTAGTLATMARGFGAYVLFAVLPVRPTADWYIDPSRGFADVAAAAWLVVHVTAVVVAFRAFVRGSLLGAAVLWFYVALAPVANWPFFLGIPTAERFLHVPLAGLALAASLLGRYRRP
jgi:protein O-mannosyl-transferase